MVTANVIHSNDNGVHITSSYSPCTSDYEPRPIDDTAKRAVPGWRSQWPEYTHNVTWVDSDSKQHSLTIRTDDMDELLQTLMAIKHVIRASKAKAAESAPQAPREPQAEPDTQPCPTHHNVIMQKRASRSGGHFYSHRLAHGDWCNGRDRK